jgi:tetratricopeptide (TPR) repeat protein
MGGAFPLLARLAFRDESIGDAFGRLGAVNTLGGVAGSLIAPFILLPALGSAAAGLVLAAGNATIGLICLAGRGSGRRLATAGTLLLITAAPLGHRAAPAPDPWVVFVEEGRETTAVVTSSWGNRTLFVDGDPEAASTGHARRTEELLAVLPALLHPSPDRSLEVGLGSGITLGTTARFPLSQIDCVEISPSVVRAASFFVPDNRNVLQSSRVRIENEDARRLLARRVGTYDIISANTLHPWSAGATGLYSHEYFSRMSDALRPNGIAVQWVPTQQIGSTSLSLILRTFFDVFPEGGLWWGAGNVIAVGSMQPLSSFDPRRAEERIQQAGLDWARLGWRNAHEVPSHRIASAAAVRSALGSGNLLFDDRPVLGFYAMRDPSADRAAKLYATLVEIARQEPGKGQMLLWLESLQKRSAGNESTADTLERLASGLGLLIADHALVDRLVAAAHRDLRAARPAEAEEHFEAALAIDPDDRHALFGRAGLAIEAGEIGAAEEALERALSRWPEDVRAWNELAGIYARSGAIDRARATTIKALTANPFDIRSLANAGLIEVRTGNLDGARAMLKRIADLSPLGRSPQEIFLRDALSPSSELR